MFVNNPVLFYFEIFLGLKIDKWFVLFSKTLQMFTIAKIATWSETKKECCLFLSKKLLQRVVLQYLVCKSGDFGVGLFVCQKI